MKKMVIALILTFMVIITGCGTQESKGATLEDPFIGGTDGIIISFEEDAPPAEVYDGGDFPFGVVVKLKNEGEQDVMKGDVEVVISGIFASEFDKQEVDLKANPLDDLDGNKKDSEGDIVESVPIHVEFDDFNHVSELTGNTPYTIRADVCYKYGTTANSMICVRKDNLDVDDGVCEVREDKSVFSSGAPLQIIDFSETARAKDKVAFTFTISHKGNGQIFQQSTNCDTSTRSFEDSLWIEVETGIDGLDCLGLKDGTASSGYIKLYGDEKKITCTQTVDTDSDYEKSVVIKLMYDYKDNKEKTLLVKHALS